MKNNILVLLSISFFTMMAGCRKSDKKLCPNGLDNEHPTVVDCECRLGHIQYYDNSKCQDYIYHFNPNMVVYSQEGIGNFLIDKGYLYGSYMMTWPFHTTDPRYWTTWDGDMRVKLGYHLPKGMYNSDGRMLYDADVRVRGRAYGTFENRIDSFQLDLRDLPDSLGYTDAGEGIFISYNAWGGRIERTGEYYGNLMIHLTAPGDTSYTPIRSVPVDDIREE